MSSHTTANKQTDIWHKAISIEKAAKLRYQEIQLILRVKFALTKFKEENLEPRVGVKLLLLTKLLQQG